MPICFFIFFNERKSTDPDGNGGRKELECIEEGETIIRIYSMKKKTLSTEEKIEKTPRLNENIKSFFPFFIDPICLIKISSKLHSEYSHHTLSSCS